MPVNIRTLIILCTCLCVLANCRARQRGGDEAFDRALAPGESGLELVPVAQHPRFHLSQVNRADFQKGIQHSLTYLRAASAAQHYPIDGIRQAQVVRALQKLDQFLTQHPQATAGQLQDYVRRHFKVYRSVGYNGRGSVLFTAYYTPIFKASKRRHGPYQYPLYKRPADLVSGKTGKDISHRRLANGQLSIYPDRATIERSKMLDGTELCYLTDPFDAYVIHVQGSARLRLEDGSLWEIGYNGTNGHEYKSVPLKLVKDGKMKENEISLQNLRRYFQRNPRLLDRYLHHNPRFVFFKATQGGPFGSLGQQVTADVSIATDKSIFPRGALCWVETTSPNQQLQQKAYGAFRLDQDTGGAIRAPGRCDLYMGIGPAAERRAGRQLAQGTLYYLVAQ